MHIGVVNGVELAVHVEEGNLLALHLNQLALTSFDLVSLGHRRGGMGFLRSISNSDAMARAGPSTSMEGALRPYEESS